MGSRRLIKIILEPKNNKAEEEKVNIFRGGDIQKHRFNVLEILMNTNATPIRCRGGIGYACCFCTKQYPDPADLKKHTMESHDDISKFNYMKRKEMNKFHVKLDITALKCNICDKNIDTLEILVEHLNKVHDKKLFTDIKNQILPFKFHDDQLTCFICNNVYHKFKSLLEHMNTHYRNYVCEVCDAGFVSRTILVAHSESHKLGRFKCSHCEKEFNTERKKKYHEKYVHSKSLSFKCGYCTEKFKDYWKKEKHLINVHGVTPLKIKCQACERSFLNQKDLNVHVRRSHLMDKRHKCTDCDMSFFSMPELRNHVVKHTGLRKFECEVCHKSYARKKTLREHLRIHANDRRFKCKLCGLAFVQKCSWRSHVRWRHGDQV